ncbi:hypothetical protein HPB47_021572, partial [Ixodes persulcatus]
GVVSEDHLLESSQEEILGGLSGQRVLAVRLISIRRDGQWRQSKRLVLTFASTVLPQSIKEGYPLCKASVPCRGKTTCEKCGATDHPADTCEGRVLKCVNCSGAHPTTLEPLQKFREEKKILTLKIKKNLTYPARHICRSGCQGGSAAPKCNGGHSVQSSRLGMLTQLPTTSEVSVGSETPAAPPKVPRTKTIPHRPVPMPRVVPDATPSQSTEGCQGVVSEDHLMESSQEEILEGISGQGVVAVRLISIRRDGQWRQSKRLVLTFASTVLPQSIKEGYLLCKAKTTFFPPRRHLCRSGCQGGSAATKCNGGHSVQSSRLGVLTQPPTTSEVAVGSETPAAPPKVPPVLDATPSQSTEGFPPSASQREEEVV